MIERLINTSNHNDLGVEGGLAEQLVLKWLETEKISQAELSRHQSKELSTRGW